MQSYARPTGFRLIANSQPLIGLYAGHGYLRVSVEQYDGADPDNKAAHITNNATQKGAANYEQMISETVWSMVP